MNVYYTINHSNQDSFLVARTESGICALYLGEEREALIDALKNEYPEATIEESQGKLQAEAEQIREYFDGQSSELNLPVDVDGTEFQQQVWQQLQSIPFGEKRTYSDIAQAIGQPKAVRAVGRACATNAVSLIIPCHRVIREDGQLGGYRWGLERKQMLLDHEKTHTLNYDDREAVAS